MIYRAVYKPYIEQRIIGLIWNVLFCAFEDEEAEWRLSSSSKHCENALLHCHKL